jgi:hypothetical protein
VYEQDSASTEQSVQLAKNFQALRNLHVPEAVSLIQLVKKFLLLRNPQVP